jgi:hypothetical protein
MDGWISPREHVSDFWQTKPWLAWLFNESPVNATVAVNDRWGSDCRGSHGGYYVCENGGYVAQSCFSFRERYQKEVPLLQKVYELVLRS